MIRLLQKLFRYTPLSEPPMVVDLSYATLDELTRELMTRSSNCIVILELLAAPNHFQLRFGGQQYDSADALELLRVAKNGILQEARK